jgi:hypothetical protein
MHGGLRMKVKPALLIGVLLGIAPMASCEGAFCNERIIRPASHADFQNLSFCTDVEGLIDVDTAEWDDVPEELSLPDLRSVGLKVKKILFPALESVGSGDGNSGNLAGGLSVSTSGPAELDFSALKKVGLENSSAGVGLSGQISSVDLSALEYVGWGLGIAAPQLSRLELPNLESVNETNFGPVETDAIYVLPKAEVLSNRNGVFITEITGSLELEIGTTELTRIEARDNLGSVNVKVPNVTFLERVDFENNDGASAFDFPASLDEAGWFFFYENDGLTSVSASGFDPDLLPRAGNGGKRLCHRVQPPAAQLPGQGGGGCGRRQYPRRSPRGLQRQPGRWVPRRALRPLPKYGNFRHAFGERRPKGFAMKKMALAGLFLLVSTGCGMCNPFGGQFDGTWAKEATVEHEVLGKLPAAVHIEEDVATGNGLLEDRTSLQVYLNDFRDHALVMVQLEGDDEKSVFVVDLKNGELTPACSDLAGSLHNPMDLHSDTFGFNRFDTWGSMTGAQHFVTVFDFDGETLSMFTDGGLVRCPVGDSATPAESVAWQTEGTPVQSLGPMIVTEDGIWMGAAEFRDYDGVQSFQDWMGYQMDWAVRDGDNVGYIVGATDQVNGEKFVFITDETGARSDFSGTVEETLISGSNSVLITRSDGTCFSVDLTTQAQELGSCGESGGEAPDPRGGFDTGFGTFIHLNGAPVPEGENAVHIIVREYDDVAALSEEGTRFDGVKENAGVGAYANGRCTLQGDGNLAIGVLDCTDQESAFLLYQPPNEDINLGFELRGVAIAPIIRVVETIHHGQGLGNDDFIRGHDLVQEDNSLVRLGDSDTLVVAARVEGGLPIFEDTIAIAKDGTIYKVHVPVERK